MMNKLTAKLSSWQKWLAEAGPFLSSAMLDFLTDLKLQIKVIKTLFPSIYSFRKPNPSQSEQVQKKKKDYFQR